MINQYSLEPELWRVLRAMLHNRCNAAQPAANSATAGPSLHLRVFTPRTGLVESKWRAELDDGDKFDFSCHVREMKYDDSF
jgi:hypothetical protein